MLKTCEEVAPFLSINNLELLTLEEPAGTFLYVTVRAPAGDKLAVTFHAEKGSFAEEVIYVEDPESQYTFARSKYKRPTGPDPPEGSSLEPPELDSDMLWVEVDDLTTGLHAESGHFQIIFLPEESQESIE